MKKIFSILLILSFAISYLPVVNVFAETETSSKISDNSGNKSIWETSEVRKIKLGKKLDYSVTLKTSKPYEVTANDGQKFYQKKIKASGRFNSEDKEKTITNEFEVTFSYDGTSAWIEDIDKDIKASATSISHSKFKGSTCEKILKSGSQCIVSEQISVFKKKTNRAKKKWKDADNLHIDAVCNPNGDIVFNSKDHCKKPYFSGKATEKSTLLEDKVIRKVVEVDNKITKNKDGKFPSDDTYNYVTRQMKIFYTDLSGNVLSRAVIEANFRYNKVSGEVECLSTSHANVFGSNDDHLKAFMRTGNRTKNFGGAYGEIKFTHHSGYLKESFEETITITCDSNGIITSEINY